MVFDILILFVRLVVEVVSIFGCHSVCYFFFFFSSRRRHTRFSRDWCADVCSSDLDNIFVTRDGGVKLLDFGLAAQSGGGAPEDPDDTTSPTRSRHTDPGTILGTAGYMAPEQVRSEERRVGKEGISEG